MTREEYRQILDSWGYEWDSDSTSPEGFWVRINQSTIKFVNVEWELAKVRPAKHGDAPSFHRENHFPSGKFRYATHERHPNEVQDCIQDYADPVGRQAWDKYVVVRDKSGQVLREGPAPFGSKDERRRYETLTGLKHRDKGEGQRSSGRITPRRVQK